MSDDEIPFYVDNPPRSSVEELRHQQRVRDAQTKAESGHTEVPG